jgi:hypothetical protein
MIFLAPIAAAGYLYWDKKRKEKLAEENGEGDELAEESVNDKPSDGSTGDNSQEETSWDMIGETGETKEYLTVTTEETPSIASSTSESLSSSLLTTPDVSPSKSAAEAGPVGKFRKFCNNLEKEFDKAQERKAQEEVWREKLEALDEPQGAIPKIAGPHASVPKITFQ